jgi:phenylalanyl-tRNA synthetase alpha chain
LEDRIAAVRDWSAEVLERLGHAETGAELRAIREEINGKDSPLTLAYRGLKDLDVALRPEVGRILQEVRASLEAKLAEVSSRILALEEEERVKAERDDLSYYVCRSRFHGSGSLHLITRTRMELEDIFVALGFSVADGPEVESEWNNFEALNIGKHHPARASQDSFYLNFGEPESWLLRTHTSPIQIRLMTSSQPPIYAVAPGRVYRRDTPDARHTPAFHQIEALVVDRGISFAHLKGTIERFTRAYFGPDISARLRPAYFPFTEPSAEFEITCTICKGSGCRTCSGTGWIELGGAGMVHPNVFKAVGIDSEEFSGFAFGFGIDRLAQMRSALPDMRVLPENDLRVLTQFRRLG